MATLSDAQRQRWREMEEKVQRLFEGPTPQPPAGTPRPNVRARSDYAVAHNGTVHTLTCTELHASCAGCSPIGADEAYRRGLQDGPWIGVGPVDSSMIYTVYGEAYLEGLTKARNAAIAYAHAAVEPTAAPAAIQQIRDHAAAEKQDVSDTELNAAKRIAEGYPAAGRGNPKNPHSHTSPSHRDESRAKPPRQQTNPER